MAKLLVIGIFTCLEYAVVLLFIAVLVFTLAQQLDNLIPYDYSAERELLDAVRDGLESKQITSQQGVEILQTYRDDQARLERRRTRIFYVVLTCISTGFMMLLFKEYRSLRLRERFRDYFFPPKP
jgi:predicted PurR-regulated permease PerM